jgi:hypothetical protein
VRTRDIGCYLSKVVKPYYRLFGFSIPSMDHWAGFAKPRNKGFFPLSLITTNNRSN